MARGHNEKLLWRTAIRECENYELYRTVRLMSPNGCGGCAVTLRLRHLLAALIDLTGDSGITKSDERVRSTIKAGLRCVYH